MMKRNSTGEVLGKVIPRKRSVFGGLASPARFERAAFRLGAHEACVKKARYLGKNDYCVKYVYAGNAVDAVVAACAGVSVVKSVPKVI